MNVLLSIVSCVFSLVLFTAIVGSMIMGTGILLSLLFLSEKTEDKYLDAFLGSLTRRNAH